MSAKTALEFGLEPIIVEKKQKLGGIWNKEDGFTWDSMRTNLSKHTCMFSDYPWNNETSDFPFASEVGKYLQEYAEHFDILDKIIYGTEVEKLENIDNLWKVYVRDLFSGDVKELITDYVIVASGFFSLINIPRLTAKIPPKNIIHSSAYKNPEIFKTKNVCIIGGSFSGFEIAAEISKHSEKVDHFITRAPHILPRYVKNSKKIPIDLFLYNRKNKKEKSKSDSDKYETTRIYLNSLFGNPGQVDPNLNTDLNIGLPPYVVISDDYLKQVSKKKIKVVKYDKKEMTIDDSFKAYDYVICCTGFFPDLSFLPNKLLKEIKFQRGNLFQPHILYKGTLPIKTKTVGFVGMYRGPYFGIMELQARLVMMYFLDLVKVTQEELDNEFEKEIDIRQIKDKPQFPRANYTEFADQLAKMTQVMPYLE
ncbi:NAD(P)-binding domain-containing protein, partial [Winogradskyella sp.]